MQNLRQGVERVIRQINALLSVRGLSIISPLVIFPVIFVVYSLPGLFNIGITSHGMNHVNTGELLATVGVCVVSYLLGVVLAMRYSPRSTVAVFDYSLVDWSRFRRVVVVAFAIGLVYSLPVSADAFLHGSLPILAHTRNAYRLYTPNDIYTMFWYLVISGILAFVGLLQSPKNWRLYSAIILMSSMMLITTASRYWLGYLLTTGLVFLASIKKSINFLWMLIGLFLSIMIIWLMWEIRLQGHYGNYKASPLVTLYLFSRTNMESLQAAFIEFPLKHRFLHGEFLFGRWLDLLPGHGPNPGAIMTVLLWHNPPVVGTTPSLPGAFYVDFGWPGIVFGFLLMGVTLGLLWRKFGSDGVLSWAGIAYIGTLSFWVNAIYASEPFHVYWIWFVLLLEAAFLYVTKQLKILKWVLVPVVVGSFAGLLQLVAVITGIHGTKFL